MGSRWEACNPVRGERNPSLSVYADGGWKDFASGDKGGDLVALAAYLRDVKQGEAADQILAELGGAEAAPTVARHAPAPRPTPDDGWQLLDPVPAELADDLSQITYRRQPPEMLWRYTSLDGDLRCVVARWPAPDGGRKVIRQFTCWRNDDGRIEWRKKWIKGARPLYNMHRLASSPDAVVVVVEGEKAADALQAIMPGIVAVTWPGGVDNIRHADWQWLAMRTVVIWPDSDDAGTSHLLELVTVIQDACASSVSVLNLDRVAVELEYGTDRTALTDAIGHGWDAADWPAEAAWMLPTALTDWVVSQDQNSPPQSHDDQARPWAAAITPSGDPYDPRYHRQVIEQLTHWVRQDQRLRPDAIDGWRDVRTWSLVPHEIGSLIEDWLLDARGEFAVGKEYALDTLRGLSNRWRAERRAEIVDTILADGSIEDGRRELMRWVRAVTGEERELDHAVMLHWLWMVKRRATGRPTDHDLMPVLYGKLQGSGKTTAVDLLCQPLAELAVMVDATYLTDDRRAPLLTKALVARWEEMQGAGRSDIEALKHTLTSPTVSWRQLRTHQVVILPKTASFIATSNISVDVMVQDTTGARRFYQLAVPSRCDWDALNELDYRLIWQAVSAADPAPIRPYLTQLQEAQVGLVHRDPIALWLDSETWDRAVYYLPDVEQPEIVPAYDPTVGESLERIGLRFRSWCLRVNQSPLGIRTLSQRLHQEGAEYRQIRLSDGRRERRYFLPPQFTAAQRSTQEGSDDAAF